jgi:hypothetical protein
LPSGALPGEGYNFFSNCHRWSHCKKNPIRISARRPPIFAKAMMMVEGYLEATRTEGGIWNTILI